MKTERYIKVIINGETFKSKKMKSSEISNVEWENFKDNIYDGDFNRFRIQLEDGGEMIFNDIKDVIFIFYG